LSFNPFNEWILATTSGDATVKLFDMRKLSRSLHTFDSHEYVIFVCALCASVFISSVGNLITAYMQSFYFTLWFDIVFNTHWEPKYVGK